MDDRQMVLIFPSGGVFFYWMLGYMDHVRQKYDLEDVEMIGASAGALAMVCSVLELDPSTITRKAFRIMDEHGVGKRWFGLFGVWKMILREWLEEILPSDAVEKLQGRVHIRLSCVPYGSMIVSSFKNRHDLVECLLTTCHVPFFMDYRPFCWYRGKLCYDGDIGNNIEPFILSGKDKYKYHVLDYSLDNQTSSYRRFGSISMDHALRLLQFGVDYAKNTDLPSTFNMKSSKTSYWT